MNVDFVVGRDFDCAGIAHFLSHQPGIFRINEQIFLEKSEGDRNLELAARCMSAYARMRRHELSEISPEQTPGSGIWEMMKNEFHGEFYRLIGSDEVAGFARYMNNAMRETLTHGLGPGEVVFAAMSVAGEELNTIVVQFIDELTSLAEAVGALRYECPEQGPYGEAMSRSATELVNLIEASLGFRIGRPPVMGNFGILVNGSIIDVRVPDDTYTSYRTKSIIDAYGLNGVCEIGGGLGGNAIQALRVGLPSYTIADIPSVSVIQGWFLSEVLGAEKVHMFGEPYSGQPIKLIPYWEFFNRRRTFDLVVNRDSMPEIPIEHASAYIKEMAERRCYFLSINQEAAASGGDIHQHVVRDLVSKRGGFTCLGRFPSWTRRGYIEELFAPSRRELIPIEPRIAQLRARFRRAWRQALSLS